MFNKWDNRVENETIKILSQKKKRKERKSNIEKVEQIKNK